MSKPTTPAAMPSSAHASPEATTAEQPPANEDEDMVNGEDIPPPTISTITQQPRTQEEEQEPDDATLAAEARIAQKKDVTLREFLSKMDDYAPIIPDALTNHYLTLAGLPPPPHTPLPLARLLALATQKFIADIAADAYQYARIRQGHSAASGPTNAGLAAAAAAQAGAAPLQPVAAVAGGVGANKGVTLGAQRPGFGGGGAGSGGGAGQTAGANAQGRTVLTMEDLGMAVGEYGVNVKRGEFYR